MLRISNVAGSFKTVMYKDKFLGLEAWAEYRRTGYPELAPSIDNLSTDGVVTRRGARRLVYPISERDYNSTNYQNAVANLLDGQDTQAKDLFWAKKD